MLERLAALDSEDAEAQCYIENAREILRRAASVGDYELADKLLFKAEEAQDRTLLRVEAFEREAHNAAATCGTQELTRALSGANSASPVWITSRRSTTSMKPLIWSLLRINR